MEGLITSVRDGVRTIKFNRPQRKNAVNRNLYKALTDILTEDSKDDTIIVTILTGEGEYFTSGNDLKAAMDMSNDGDFDKKLLEANDIFRKFIQAFINYPKLLIAVVNGPAVGIGTTIIGLCDVVYASERATFHTPFVNLGLCCEGCSSVMFPMLMGRSRASEILLLGKKISAQEALERNLISRVVPHQQLEKLFLELQSYGKLPLKSIMVNKKLIVDGMREKLLKCNDRECKALLDRITSEDFLEAVVAFLSRKSKL